MKLALSLVLTLFLVLVTGGVSAQDSLRIVAVVNDQIISAYDLDMRLALVTTFAGMPDTIETRQRLAPQTCAP
jgi:peptidyl-prolyl cis-trans isomerase SurA